MRFSPNFTVRSFRGKCLLSISSGSCLRTFEVNDSFHYLVERFKDSPFELEDLSSALQERYGIDAGLADNDAKAVLAIWQEFRMIQD